MFKKKMTSAKNTPIYKKLYFLILVGTPLVLTIISTGSIIYNSQLYFCWTNTCFDYFAKYFEFPINLFGATLIIAGVVVAYYRVDLTYKQNQHQLEQFTLSSHQVFKGEFISLLNRKEDDYYELQLRPEWLFSALYPLSKQGDNNLNPEFADFIKTDIHQNQDFFHAMEEIEKGVNSQDKNRYFAGTYRLTSQLSLWLIEFVGYDMNVNLGYIAGGTFQGKFADHVIGLTKDIFYIVCIVKSFEGWRYFDNKQRRKWRRNIDKLELVKKESEQLSETLSNEDFRAWRSEFYRDDCSKLNNPAPLALGFLPKELRNNISAKQFFHYAIVNHFVPEKNKREELANALNINFIQR